MSLLDISINVDNFFWGKVMIYLCLAAGVYFSVLMRFPQLRLIKDMVGQLLGGKSSAKGVSSFQGFAMALGGRVGTGNITGVASAIFFGGPGAVFWMWAIAFLGAGSAYIEAALAQVAEAEGKTPAQTALNWLKDKPGVTAPIIGARRIAHLEDNLGAIGWSLSAENRAKLDAISDMPVAYPDNMTGVTGRER